MFYDFQSHFHVISIFKVNLKVRDLFRNRLTKRVRTLIREVPTECQFFNGSVFSEVYQKGKGRLNVFG